MSDSTTPAATDAPRSTGAPGRSPPPSPLQLPRYERLEVAREGDHILVVKFNRPEVLNAIDTQTGRDTLDLWTRLAAEPGELRCVVLTGAGDRAFCAGGDLKERHGMDDDAWRRQHEIFERSFMALMDCPLPVIAAVNGHAYGGGLETALACDFVYASFTARFSLSEVRLGIMPGGRRHPDAGTGRRRAARQGADSASASVRRRAGRRVGTGQPVVRTRCGPRRCRCCRPRDRGERAACRAPGQEVDPFRPAVGHRDRLPVRDRGLQPAGGIGGSARGRAGIQREAQARVQGALT